MSKILIVEDEDSVRKSITASLKSATHQIFEAGDVANAWKILRSESIDLVLSDLRLPNKSGIQLLRELKSQDYPCEIVIMTGYATVDNAVQAMKDGASDYITKPFNIGELMVRIERALKQTKLRNKVQRLEKKLEERFQPENIISNSKAMNQIKQQIKNIAPSDSSVLITGESGTGKELIANAIHVTSPRSEKPFVAINCGALPETLLESELFGHIKGAFTGATETKQGLIASSDGGTLLLDEIGEASPSVQVKLLRVLEDGTIRRVGDSKEQKVNVRLLASTNKDLTLEMEAGRFRRDLFYRINVIPIQLPPLRDRLEDVPILAKFFLKRHTARLLKNIADIDNEVIDRFITYNWPGNVRELENTIEYAVNMCDSDQILVNHLPVAFQKHENMGAYPEGSSNKNDILTLEELEKRYILKTLEKVKWHQKRACELLQISKVTLYRRLKKYEISPPKSGKNSTGLQE